MWNFAMIFLRIWLHGGVFSRSTGFFPVPCNDGSTEGVLLSLAGPTSPHAPLPGGMSTDRGKWAAGIWRDVIRCHSELCNHKRLKNLVSFVIWLPLVQSHFLQLMGPGEILNMMLNLWIWNKILNKTRQHWPWRIMDLKRSLQQGFCEGKCCLQRFKCQTVLHPWAELSRDLTVLPQWKQKSALQSTTSLQLLSKCHMKLLMQGKKLV